MVFYMLWFLLLNSVLEDLDLLFFRVLCESGLVFIDVMKLCVLIVVIVLDKYVNLCVLYYIFVFVLWFLNFIIC